MRKTLLFPVLAIAIAAGALMLGKAPTNMEFATAADPAMSSVLRHVVLFKFKPGTSPEDIAKVEKAFAELPKKLGQIADFEWGTDVGVENLSKGFTHCFFVTFRDEKGRDEYLPAEAHQEFVALVKPLVDDVLVIDYRPRR